MGSFRSLSGKFPFVGPGGLVSCYWKAPGTVSQSERNTVASPVAAQRFTKLLDGHESRVAPEVTEVGWSDSAVALIEWGRERN
jgi:hypothetical protein